MKYIIITFSAALCLAACHHQKAGTPAPDDASIQIDSLPGECPYLTKDAKGATVLSWVRMTGDSSTAFCYASSIDGKTFGKPTVVPASNKIQPHGENLPKIIFKPSGEIITLWGEQSTNKKNKYAGMVFYAQSFDGGKTWSGKKPLVSDTAGYDQRYYDVALLPSGEAAIIWLDNRRGKAEDGSSLYYATTTGKNGFTHETRIAGSCCQCCRTDLFVDGRGGIHTLYRGIIQDSIRDMVHSVSTDGGKTFSAPQRISNDNWVIKGCPHTGPAMTENKEGLHFAWFTGGDKKGCFYTRSTDNGKSFVMHDSISHSGSHPQLAPLSNGELVIAWDETSVINGKACKRLRVQKRTADGKAESKTFITADSSNASYPVVAALKETRAIIAYTKRNGSRDYIAYQFLN